MKKTIVTLGIVLCTFGAQAFESSAPATFEQHLAVSSATPLAIAISRGDTEAVKKFIEYGVDVNETSNGMTPLMIAARYNRVDIIEFLLEKGANPRVKTERGWTALRYAELSNATDAVALLSKK